MSNKLPDNHRILIIEDDESIWKAYQNILTPRATRPKASIEFAKLLLGEDSDYVTREEFSLFFAQQGEDGYNLVKTQSPYAVAFIDVRMPPGWNGVKTAQKIRDIDPNIEIVIVTAYADFTRENIVDLVGHADKLLYLRKPFDSEEVYQIALSLSQKWSIAHNQQQQQAEISKLVIELERTKHYLKNIIDSMPSIIIGIDQQHNITCWNQQASLFTGLAIEQAQQQTLSKIFPQLPDLQNAVAQTIQTDEITRIEKVTLVWHDDYLYVDITVYPITMTDFDSIIIRIDDITNRTHLEERMIQSEKMITVGGLAAGVSHEINNPLSSIMQNTQIIENRLSASLKKNDAIADACGINLTQLQCYLQKRGIIELLSHIREAGSRTAKIIQNMLDFSRQSTSMSRHDLSNIIDEVIELAHNDYDLKQKYYFRDFTIHRHYADNLPSIMCERVKLEQVIFNLFKNSAQAMSDYEMHEPPTLHIDIRPTDKTLRLTIKDNGPGMPEEIRRRIFEPFFTTKEVGSGTGLGLSLSYFIVTEHHNGHMEVRSEPDKGTTFIIDLPLPN